MATWPVYGTLAEHDAYHAAHGNPALWDSASDAAKVEAGRLASEYLDITYSWKGYKVAGTQVRDWPRSGVWDLDGYTVTGIPQALKDVTSYLMLRVIEGDTLIPDIAAEDLQGSVKRRMSRVEGLEEEIEFEGGARLTNSKRYPKVAAMLRNAGLIESGRRLERG